MRQFHSNCRGNFKLPRQFQNAAAVSNCRGNFIQIAAAISNCRGSSSQIVATFSKCRGTFELPRQFQNAAAVSLKLSLQCRGSFTQSAVRQFHADCRGNVTPNWRDPQLPWPFQSIRDAPRRKFCEKTPKQQQVVICRISQNSFWKK